MTGFAIIAAPFHMGIEGVAVGSGPDRLLAGGAAQVLAAERVVRVHRRDETATDLAAVADVNSIVRAEVADALARGATPVVLSGNCNACLATIGAMGSSRAGIVWLDAHGDFHTPATSRSGFLDGMALAAAVGHCHTELAKSIGLDRPVAEENVLLLAVRDLDPEEEERLDASGVTVRSAEHCAGLDDLFVSLRSRVDDVYLHLDIDFVDPGGLPLADAAELVSKICDALPVRAIGLTNYNAERDPENRTQQAALRLLEAVAGSVQ